MKLAVSSALLALALIQAPETSVAFSPPCASRRDGVLRHSPRQHAGLTSLGMVGFKDPREKENTEATKVLSRLNYETAKVKKWLADLLQPQDSDSESSASPTSNNLALFGGGRGDIAATAAAEYTASYKPALHRLCWRWENCMIKGPRGTFTTSETS